MQQFAIFLKNSLLFSQFLFSLLFIIIGSITWKTRTAMNAKISVFVVCFEAITYLLLYNLHDCTFEKRFGIWLLLTLYFLWVSFLESELFSFFLLSYAVAMIMSKRENWLFSLLTCEREDRPKCYIWFLRNEIGSFYF